MARIRSVHPGLFTDEAFVSVSMAARVLVPGIWTEADDHGIFEWKPRTLKMKIFPADNIDVDALLAELENAGIVRKFKCDGKEYGAVRNFGDYQRPKKPSYKHPFPDELRTYVKTKDVGSEPVENQFSTSTEISPQMEEEEGEKEEEGERKVSVGAVADATPGAIAMKIAENLACAPGFFDEFWKTYPKRQGANPREPAKKAFAAALKSGADPELIVAGAKRYADELVLWGKSGTQFVARAVTWLQERRWQDYPVVESATEQAKPRGVFVAIDSAPWRAWSDHYRAHGGPNGLKVAPRAARCGPNCEEGWHFPAQWPPGYPQVTEVSGAREHHVAEIH